MAYRWRDRRRPGDIQRGHGSRGRGHIHRRAGRRLPGRSRLRGAAPTRVRGAGARHAPPRLSITGPRPSMSRRP